MVGLRGFFGRLKGFEGLKTASGGGLGRDIHGSARYFGLPWGSLRVQREASSKRNLAQPHWDP
jgi:hypothetical protein